ncbi:ComEC/Rec2 family competence protein [Cognatishimia sp. MH4019]|uniref:ComEC/Rec2 family competence protein n=1 Tax=Cognatishimia sp. MH4019 TaxID=2854030 RepID=UPI001CD20373|nr:ComEC/Rec2 family competence protein [Cognatishimia sp. MH4019]
MSLPMGFLATARIKAALEAQRGHLFCWAPVAMALGIGGYFAIPFEPGGAMLTAAALTVGAGASIYWRSRESWGVFALALALVALGLLLAALRAHSVTAPVLSYRYYGPVEGRIIAIDRSVSDKVRVMLDRVVLARMSPVRTPEKVRISLHWPDPVIVPEPGMRVAATAHLSPPQGPVEPGGFTFQRMAWFKGLGAVGYARTPLLAMPGGGAQADLWIYRQRMALSQEVRDRMGGPEGGVAAAIVSGDRSGIQADTLTNLRASNLAHLLAISGLHMGLLTGVVFALLRFGLALNAHAANHWNTKKIAAIGALIAGAGYLALSGGSVATERAFIMVSVMFVAILLNRRALTLRAVAMAAVIVLVLTPEALIGPGFQMSFAATTALVAVFGALRGRSWRQIPKPVQKVGAVVLSSFVAGLATAPFAAAHFNQIAHYGLLANILSVPMMGAVVMPAAVLAAILWPLGLSGVGLWIMGLGLRWILTVADWVAGLEGAVGKILTPVPSVIPLIALGALFTILWRGRGRVLGVVPMLVAAILWAATDRPTMLISDSGALLGVMTAEGRSVSKARGESFVAGSWLENDGDPADQQTAYARSAAWEQRLRQFDVAGQRIHHATGKRATEGLPDCTGGVWLVSNQPIARDGDCRILDPVALRQTGSIALYADGRVVTAYAQSGDRLWTPKRKTARRTRAAQTASNLDQ